MSYASKKLYAGDDSTTQFNVPMPFISPDHINVYVNECLQLDPLNYVLSGTTVTFSHAPASGDAIWIKRNTSPTELLVDFHDGSVLNEADLDMQYQHNFYLGQEAKDGFNELINNAFLNVATDMGIVEEDTDDMIAALVSAMLDEEAAAVLQARVADIDNNAEAIVTLGEGLQVQITALSTGQYGTHLYYQAGEPVPGVAGVSDPIPEHSLWVDTDDGDAQYIYISPDWIDFTDQSLIDAETYIHALEAEYGANASSFITAVSAIATSAGASATSIALLGVDNGAHSAFIMDSSTVRVDTAEGDTVATKFSVVAANASSVATHATAIGEIEAEYGVDLTVNGYVSGFRLINGGTPGESAMVILADKFAIVDPSGDAEEDEYIPFQIVGGKVRFNADVEIDGDLVVSGTINGADALSSTEAHRIGSTQIGADAITTTQINADAVTADEIASNVIVGDHIFGTQLDVLAANTGTLNVDESITMSAAGHIKGGQTAYDTGTGFWIGYTGGAYKFSIGNAGTGHSLTWDGTDLTVKGDLYVGSYLASDEIILSATTQRFDSGPGAWVTKKTFTMDRGGSVKIVFDRRVTYTGAGITDNGAYQVTVNDVQDSTAIITNGSYATTTITISALEAGDIIDLNIVGGEYDTGEPTPFSTYIQDCYIKADVVIAPGGTVDLD